MRVGKEDETERDIERKKIKDMKFGQGKSASHHITSCRLAVVKVKMEYSATQHDLSTDGETRKVNRQIRYVDRRTHDQMCR